MEKSRTAIAVVLISALWIVWLMFIAPKNTAKNETAKKTNQTVTENKTDDKTDDTTVNEDNTASTSNVKKIEIKTIVEEETTKQNFNIKTGTYNISLTNQGAAIKKIEYGERKIDLNVINEEINNSGVFDFAIHFTEDSFLNGSSLEESLWSVENPSKNVYVFSIKTELQGKPVIIQKEFRFHESTYYFDLIYRIENISDGDIVLPENRVIYSVTDFLGPKLDNYKGSYNQPYSVYYADKLKKAQKASGKKFLGIFGGGGNDNATIESEKISVDWAGVVSRFFIAVMIPENFKTDSVLWDVRKDSGFRTGVTVKKISLQNGTKLENSFKICFSEKNKAKLVSVLPSLEEATGGMKLIRPIRNLVEYLLKKLHSFIPNFGWTIILFSVIIKLIFLPLTQKSTESMKKMSQLGPQITELKAKYKDKPEELQKKTMELYKENKVNPMGGCLPLVIQMPFFIALYSALSNSLDMWNTPWILWVKDLSSPDSLFYFKNLMGGFRFNLLPLIMTGTTFLQQKFTTVDTGGGSQQQMMMKMMPIIMLFIFWRMPSGLILYWIVQNLLQVAHQLVVNQKSNISIMSFLKRGSK